jgi:hypothetical protein
MVNRHNKVVLVILVKLVYEDVERGREGTPTSRIIAIFSFLAKLVPITSSDNILIFENTIVQRDDTFPDEEGVVFGHRQFDSDVGLGRFRSRTGGVLVLASLVPLGLCVLKQPRDLLAVSHGFAEAKKRVV